MDAVKPRSIMWFVAAWFASASTALIFSIAFSIYLFEVRIVKPIGQNFQLFAALPQSERFVSGDVIYSDARAKIIENFFENYKAPLSAYGQVFIQTADKYRLDWRLLPAIAMQESNGGKKVINNSYNPFGYGIYGNSVIRFNSWEEAIEKVGKGLRENYLNQGLKTPYQIMAKYTPPSLSKNGAWAKGVSLFMEELR